MRCDLGQNPSERQLEARGGWVRGMGWGLEIWPASIDVNWCHIILVTIREIRPWAWFLTCSALRRQHRPGLRDGPHSLQGSGV